MTDASPLPRFADDIRRVAPVGDAAFAELAALANEREAAGRARVVAPRDSPASRLSGDGQPTRLVLTGNNARLRAGKPCP